MTCSPVTIGGLAMKPTHKRGVTSPLPFLQEDYRRYTSPLSVVPQALLAPLNFSLEFLATQGIKISGWTVVVSPRVVLELPFYTSHLLPLHTIRHPRAVSWDPIYSIESKMKILVPGTLGKRVSWQRIRKLGLISTAGIGGCSSR